MNPVRAPGGMATAGAAAGLLAVLLVAIPIRLPGADSPPDMVIHLTVAGTTRAYPLATFAASPVVNDLVGPLAVVVFHDRDTGGAAAYFRLVGGEPIEFSGEARGGIADDLTTASRWDMLTGKAVSGGLEGQSLVPIPFRRAGREEWRKANPKGTVFGE